MTDVFVTRKIPQKGLMTISDSFTLQVWPNDFPPSKSEIIDNAKDAEGLVTLLSDPIDAELIDALPNLKVIAQYAVGFDNIDVTRATERGIMVTNTPGVLTETTADLTWALIMAVARRIPEADRYVRDNEWNVAWGPELLLGEDVYGSTLGIVGLGRIGEAVARRARGFDMRVLYYSRSRVKDEKERGIEYAALESLLKESDIVSLHVPLTDDTYHLIGENELDMMKPGSFLINTSRGPVVDEKALYRSLKKGHLGGAGLDVFHEEPLPKDSSLMDLPNVVLAPHIGSASTKTRNIMAEMCAKNLIAALSGKEPPNIVNPEVLR